MAAILFLHGASSSGKSTLARALQARADQPFLHLSIDHLRDSGVLPSARIRQGDFDWQTMRPDLFAGFHAALAAFADAGNNNIVEHILDTDGWYAALHHGLAGHDVLFVGVMCDIPTLQRREQARGDRAPGSAARDAATIHAGLTYDLEVDGTADPAANAAAVLAAWASGVRRSGISSR